MNAPPSDPADPTRGVGAAWLRYWFAPADPAPLAVTRMAVGLIGLGLLWSYAADLDRWFGRDGMVGADAAVAWRSSGGEAVIEVVDALLGARLTWLIAVAAYAAVLVGWGGAIAAVVAALSWAALMHRGPMLAGPADDCLAVLTWCMAVAPATAAMSLDRFLADRRGRPPPAPTWRTSVARGLLQVHASVIAAAAAAAQLKGDVWWDGTAAWWLAARAESRLVDLTGAYAASTYLMNLATHLIPGFEIMFAVGIWWSVTRPMLARAGTIAWPLIGVVVGEPWWGLAMAVFCTPFVARCDE